VYKVF